MIITDLENADLHVDAMYGGSRLGHAGDDPLPKLLGVDAQAGFRVLGKRKSLDTLNLIVLITSFKSIEWPDHLDRETGLFTYYGDRHSPGDIHDTPRDGNLILRNIFDAAHSGSQRIPPILVFGKGDQYRDMQFLGLAVPGAEGMGQDEDLVAVWRLKNGVRFQNYKAVFTILNQPHLSRDWIRDIQSGNAWESPHTPKVWKNWQASRKFNALTAEPVTRIRSKEEQTPSDERGKQLIDELVSFYRNRPTDFERCAMEIAKIMLPQIHSEEITRPWRDGGRDATGLYRIGQEGASLDVEFSLEAKLYGTNNGVGVKGLSRLLSRIRYRQFGILLTTSFLSRQAYQELLDDMHPVIVISASDMAMVLKKKFPTSDAVRSWLEKI